MAQSIEGNGNGGAMQRSCWSPNTRHRNRTKKNMLIWGSKRTLNLLVNSLRADHAGKVVNVESWDQRTRGLPSGVFDKPRFLPSGGVRKRYVID